MLLRKIVYNFFVYSAAFVIIITLFIPLLLIGLLPLSYRPQRFFNFLLYALYKTSVWVLLCPVDYSQAHFASDEPCIIIANHQSALDIAVVGAVVGRYPHQWLYKQELDALPVIGFFFKTIGISVAHATAMDGFKALNAIYKKCKDNEQNIILFPEGARYADGSIHEFAGGFALLAQKLQRSVVPIYLENVGRICPPGCFFINYDSVKIVVGKSFNKEPQESLTDFVNRLHLWFINQEAQRHVI